MEHNIYMFWTNTNPLSKNRDYGIKSAIKNFNGCNVVFLNKKSIDKYILPNHPLHCGYKYLSENHKSDYLRSYFMNFYGGGYADIKPYTSDNNWNECFDLMDTDKNIDVIGTPDSLDWAIVNLKYSGYSENIIKNNLHKLLCNGWFVCRKNSEFTQKWYKAV